MKSGKSLLPAGLALLTLVVIAASQADESRLMSTKEPSAALSDSRRAPLPPAEKGLNNADSDESILGLDTRGALVFLRLAKNLFRLPI